VDDKIMFRCGQLKVLFPPNPPIVLLMFQTKVLLLVNFLYPANDILTKTWKNICFKCQTCFSSKKLPHLQNQKIEKTKRDLPNYNPSNQAINPPSFLYEATDPNK
jgi:hypothetical protein